MFFWFATIKGKWISFKEVSAIDEPRKRRKRHITLGQIVDVSPRTKAYVKTLQDLVDYYENPAILSREERISRNTFRLQLKNHIRQLLKK